MQYFKNVELTKMYPVSEKAVRNWIAAAKEGKLDLALHEYSGKMYVANTSKNAAIIDSLVNERKKYVNTKGRKTVQPTDSFYKIYNKDQIFDIITHLEAYNEVPFKYSYFNDGASNWDDYSQKLATEDIANNLNQAVNLLDINTDYLLNHIKGYSRVNVVDIGPGNGQPARKFIERLLDEGRLSRYIAVDISASMLDLVKKNMTNWFGHKFPFEGYVKDIAHDRFRNVLGEDAVGAEGDSVCNIVLLLGSTLANFRSPSDALRLIYNSLGPNDLLTYSFKLDSDTAKRFFDFNASANAVQSLSPIHKKMPDVLNMDESLYDVEQFYDPKSNCRVIQIRLKLALTIEFHPDGFLRKVHFNKGDTITLFRAWHQSAAGVLELLRRSGFSLLQASQSGDHEYILAISEVKGE